MKKKKPRKKEEIIKEIEKDLKKSVKRKSSLKECLPIKIVIKLYTPDKKTQLRALLSTNASIANILLRKKSYLVARESGVFLEEEKGKTLVTYSVEKGSGGFVQKRDKISKVNDFKCKERKQEVMRCSKCSSIVFKKSKGSSTTEISIGDRCVSCGTFFIK